MGHRIGDQGWSHAEVPESLLWLKAKVDQIANVKFSFSVFPVGINLHVSLSLGEIVFQKVGNMYSVLDKLMTHWNTTNMAYTERIEVDFIHKEPRK